MITQSGFDFLPQPRRRYYEQVSRFDILLMNLNAQPPREHVSLYKQEELFWSQRGSKLQELLVPRTKPDAVADSVLQNFRQGEESKMMRLTQASSSFILASVQNKASANKSNESRAGLFNFCSENDFRSSL